MSKWVLGVSALLLVALGVLIHKFYDVHDILFSFYPNIDMWEKAAIVVNNSSSPILMLITIVLLFVTWRTNKDEIQKLTDQHKEILDQDKRHRCEQEKFEVATLVIGDIQNNLNKILESKSKFMVAGKFITDENGGLKLNQGYIAKRFVADEFTESIHYACSRIAEKIISDNNPCKIKKFNVIFEFPISKNKVYGRYLTRYRAFLKKANEEQSCESAKNAKMLFFSDESNNSIYLEFLKASSLSFWDLSNLYFNIDGDYRSYKFELPRDDEFNKILSIIDSIAISLELIGESKYQKYIFEKVYLEFGGKPLYLYLKARYSELENSIEPEYFRKRIDQIIELLVFSGDKIEIEHAFSSEYDSEVRSYILSKFKDNNDEKA